MNKKEEELRTKLCDVFMRGEISAHLDKIALLIENNMNSELVGDEQYKKHTASLMVSYLLTVSTAFSQYAYSIFNSISEIKNPEKRKIKVSMLSAHYKSQLLNVINQKVIDKDFDIKTFRSEDVLWQ